MRATRGAWLTCVVLLCGLVVGAQAAGAGPAVRVQTRAAPVSSLQPRATALQWRELVRSRRPAARRATAACHPLRAVFYAATDWLRLGTRLAANSSPCAEYHISIPPLAADKTRPRPDQAWRIRALGPSFHALAEISWNAWSAWVAAGNGSYRGAGVEARRRMAAAGYDVAAGDGWALNELSSAVRRGDGAARTNVRELLRGLYEADGVLPVARGTAFMVGIGQGTTDLSVYKANLQNWLQDTAFWSDMAAYVSDWSQESYGDVRNYAVPGAPLAARRDALRAYLGHGVALAAAGGEPVAVARTFLQAAYSPLANAAWEWGDSFGWTSVPVAEMKDFVSAQTHALRHVSTGTGRAGFAWAPRNAAAIPAGDFAAQSAEVLDRLAAAIRDSGEDVDVADPGVGACAPAGTNVWCVAERGGAAFNAGWGGFSAWSPPGAAFATPPQIVSAGAASAPIGVQLQLAGVPQLAAGDVPVELTSTSPTGAFSTTAAGPWTPALTVAVPSGTTIAPSVYYLDTQPGVATVTARAPGGAAAQGVAVETAGQSGGGIGTPADLVLSGSVDVPAPAVGAIVVWGLRVDDRTLQTVSGVAVDISLPAGHAFVSASTDRGSGCAETAPGRLRCTVDFLNAAAPTATVAVTTRARVAGTHVLTATVAFAGVDPTPADNAVTLRAVTPTAAPRAPASSAAPKRIVRSGGAGADVLVGGAGADVLRGRGGNDILRGKAGNDRLDGGRDADTILGGPGTDRLEGGAGDDRVLTRDGKRDVVVCGPGRDRVIADRADRVSRSCERVARG